MLEIFGKYGQIVSIKFAPQNIGTKRAYLRFDTYDQALKAFDMHLKQYRGHLVRVAFMNKRQKERPGYSVIIKVAGRREYHIYITLIGRFYMRLASFDRLRRNRHLQYVQAMRGHFVLLDAIHF